MHSRPLLTLACLFATLIASPVDGSTWTFHVGSTSQNKVFRMNAFKLHKITRGSPAALAICCKTCVLRNSECSSIAFSLVSGKCDVLNKKELTDAQGTIVIPKNQDAAAVVIATNSTYLAAARPSTIVAPATVMATVSLRPESWMTTRHFVSSNNETATSTISSTQEASVVSDYITEKSTMEEVPPKVSNSLNNDRSLAIQIEHTSQSSTADGFTMTSTSSFRTSPQLQLPTLFISGTYLTTFDQRYSTTPDSDILPSSQEIISPAEYLSSTETFLAANKLLPKVTSLSTNAHTSKEASPTELFSQTRNSSLTETLSLSTAHNEAQVMLVAATLLEESTLLQTQTSSAKPIASQTFDNKIYNSSSEVSIADSELQMAASPSIVARSEYSWPQTTPKWIISTSAPCGPFDPEKDICCNGVIDKRKGPRPACCGSHVYDTNMDSCCSGVVTNGPNC